MTVLLCFALMHFIDITFFFLQIEDRYYIFLQICLSPSANRL